MATDSKKFFVYIIECVDSSLYTGYTTDLDRRMSEHKSGDPKSAKYIQAKGFKRLVYKEILSSKSAAMKREYQIKQLSRSSKLELIDKNTAE